ncbi:MAG: tetratricopeptide repeat protein [Bdellovibrio sp.]|nr:tetratricopeptide repeat protein [Bdellovibrio sp.]
MNMKKTLKVFIILCLILVLSSCLKTRSQLKEDGMDAPDTVNNPVSTEVKDVKPQGQYIVDEIKSEITHITGRIEELERNLKQGTNAANKEEVKKLENRMTELEQAQLAILESLKKLQATVPIPDNLEFYEKGRMQFQSKDYRGAVDTFTEYLKAQKPKRGEDALFLRAESYYLLKDYKKAIIDFSKFPEKYQKSSKLSLALYKIGLSFESLGMKEDAKGFYQELVEKFPKSKEASRAKAKLK